jgi:hypothetical protein
MNPKCIGKISYKMFKYFWLVGWLVGWLFETETQYVYSPGWPQTRHPFASASQVLGLQACTTMPGIKAAFLSYASNKF